MTHPVYGCYDRVCSTSASSSPLYSAADRATPSGGLSRSIPDWGVNHTSCTGNLSRKRQLHTTLAATTVNQPHRSRGRCALGSLACRGTLYRVSSQYPICDLRSATLCTSLSESASVSPRGRRRFHAQSPTFQYTTQTFQ